MKKRGYNGTEHLGARGPRTPAGGQSASAAHTANGRMDGSIHGWMDRLFTNTNTIWMYTRSLMIIMKTTRVDLECFVA